jgi:hypothetical protein
MNALMINLLQEKNSSVQRLVNEIRVLQTKEGTGYRAILATKITHLKQRLAEADKLKRMYAKVQSVSR